MTIFDMFFRFARAPRRHQTASVMQMLAEDVEFEEITTEIVKYENNQNYDSRL